MLSRTKKSIVQKGGVRGTSIIVDSRRMAIYLPSEDCLIVILYKEVNSTERRSEGYVDNCRFAKNGDLPAIRRLSLQNCNITY